MVDSDSDLPLPAAEWLQRCSERIRELDVLIRPDDALDLAQVLWGRPSCRRIAPELAAEKMFDDDLTSSKWITAESPGQAAQEEGS